MARVDRGTVRRDGALPRASPRASPPSGTARRRWRRHGTQGERGGGVRGGVRTAEVRGHWGLVRDDCRTVWRDGALLRASPRASLLVGTARRRGRRRETPGERGRGVGEDGSGTAVLAHGVKWWWRAINPCQRRVGVLQSLTKYFLPHFCAQTARECLGECAKKRKRGSLVRLTHLEVLCPQGDGLTM